MDANTKDVWLVGLGIVSTLATPVALWLYAKHQSVLAAKSAEKLGLVEQTINQVKHQTDGLTEKLVGAKSKEAALEATAAEKEAQADRETEQAKGAAAARQADAGAKANVPLAMASPPPEGANPPEGKRRDLVLGRARARRADRGGARLLPVPGRPRRGGGAGMKTLVLLVLLAPALAQAATGTATHRHADLLNGQALFELGVCLDTGPCVLVSSGPTPDPVIQDGDRVLVDTVQAMTQGRATTRYVLTPLMVRTPKRFGAASAAAVSGMHPTLIIRIAWPGAAAASTHVQAEATGQAVSAFFAANSYGRLTMTFDHVAVTLAQAPSGCAWSAIATQAEAAARALGVTPSAYLHRVYAIPWTTACQWAGLATIGGSQAWINGIYITSPQVVAHELGHNLGLRHSNSMRCAAGTVLSPPCTETEYGDYFDTMGSGNTMHFNAAQKHALGWLEAQVVTGGTVRLTPVETTPSAIQVPRGGGTDTLFLEHRPTSPTLLDPVLVHLRSSGTYLLRMGAQGWPLPVGATWTVPGGPTIQVDAADAAGAQVTVNPPVVWVPPAGSTDLTQTFPAAPGLHTLGACSRQVGGTSLVRIGAARAPIANPRLPFVMRCVTTDTGTTLSINGVVKLTTERP